MVWKSPRVSPRVSQLFAYAMSTALLAIAALSLIPAMISASSLVAWGSVATGQAIGVLGSTAINFGWPILGPALIGSSSAHEQRIEVLRSLRLRALLSLLVIPACVLTVLVLAPAFPAEALGGVAMGIALGAGTSWFFIGRREPWKLLAWDTMPRVAFSGASIVGLYAGALSVASAAFIVAGGILAGAVLSAVAIEYQLSSYRGSISEQPFWGFVRERASGVSTALASNLSITAPVIVLSVVAPMSVGMFALVDRPVRQIASGLSVVVNQVQGDLADRHASEFISRARRVTVGVAIATPVAALVFSGLGIVLLEWLSGDAGVPVWGGPMVGLLTALTFADLVLSRAVLPPLGALRALSIIANASLAATILGTLAGGAVAGALGALGCLALATAAKVTSEFWTAIVLTKHATGPISPAA